MQGKEKSSDGASPKEKSVLPALPRKPTPLLLEILQAELLRTRKHENNIISRDSEESNDTTISTHGVHPLCKE
jgi:hypothetical protein